MAVRKTGTPRTRNTGKKAPRKAAPRGKPQRVPLAMVFWILFIIVLATTFFAFLPAVRKNSSRQDQPVAEQSTLEQETPAVTQMPAAAPAQSSQQEQTGTTTPVERTPVEAPPVPQESPAGQTSSQPQTTVPEERPVETRDRSVYFMQETRGGAELLLVKVTRRMKVSDSPLFDSLNALLMGPTADERNRGLINFLPPETQILSALIRGNTAYISFNEEFQYNTYGREGFAAQVKQIVWTATEFPTVHDVQILIEGSRVDFLGEGIMIGSPIQR